jgi:glucose-6-phosphate isomerase
MQHINNTATWKNLSAHFSHAKQLNMRELFANDAQRFEKYSLETAGLFLDYSKNIITDETLALLQKLTAEVNLREKTDTLFRGDNMNPSEKKPVLHVAMRNRSNTPILVQGKDVMPQINEVLERMHHFVKKVRSGEYKGITGKAFTDIVNISIGGSTLGPQMVTTALAPYAHEPLNCHFVSNVDATDIATALKNLNPETTLFIVGSKSFTTIETSTNADTAKDWLIQKLGVDAVKTHFIASTINVEKALEYGIARENIFEFWAWVGGRFSVWSSIGLVVALSIGMENFEKLLSGAHAMDMHFKSAPFEKNMPVILALLGVWYHNFFEAESYSVVCYDEYLKRFPTYLQQVDMESNGKSVYTDGTHVNISTGPIIWGDCGTNSQHSFHQLFHQGTHLIPIDFIMPINSWHPIGNHHPLLVANCFGQAQALLNGKTIEQAYQELIKKGMSEADAKILAPQKAMPGNRPSNMLLFDKLTPEVLGALMSLYELKIFTQGIIWGINSFDQWGVELGKELANTILPDLMNEKTHAKHDGSTEGLIKLYHHKRL